MSKRQAELGFSNLSICLLCPYLFFNDYNCISPGAVVYTLNASPGKVGGPRQYKNKQTKNSTLFSKFIKEEEGH